MDEIISENDLMDTSDSDVSSVLSMDDIRLSENFAEKDTVSDNSITDVLLDDAVVPEHVAELMVPFAKTPAGEDPRYSDDFFIIKSEIDKLTGNDYDEILKRSRNILKDIGKDIRVAGYYLQSAVYVQGISGLIDGIMLCRMLADLFYADIHPKKESAKLSALEWINNNKVAIYAKHAIEECSEEQLGKLKVEVQQFNEVVKNLIADKPPLLTSLNKFLADAKPKREIFIKPRDSESDIPNTVATDTVLSSDDGNPAVSNPPATHIVEINSTEDLMESTRLISMYLLGNKEYLRSWGVTHATRWSGLNIPPNDNGTTRLPAPRQSVKTDIQTLLDNRQLEQAFLLCQKVFLEATNHLFFDIQYLAYQAAEGMENIKLADFIVDTLTGFVRNQPGIHELTFDDGTQFADEATRMWINSLDTSATPVTAIIAPQSDNSTPTNNALQELQEAAIKVFMTSGLQQALDTINDFSSSSEKESFQVKLLIAKLCMDEGKFNIAVPMLEELYQQTVTKSLYVWEPEMAMAVAINLQNGIRSIMKKSSETQKEKCQTLLDELSSQMCRWSPIQAAKIL